MVMGAAMTHNEPADQTGRGTLGESRRRKEEAAGAEKAIRKNNAEIEHLYAVQAKALISGNREVFATAGNEIKFLKAQNALLASDQKGSGRRAAAGTVSTGKYR